MSTVLSYCSACLSVCVQLYVVICSSSFVSDLIETAAVADNINYLLLQPKSFWDIWDLTDSLSSRVALSFQCIPGHAGLLGNERAGSLAKTGATLSVTHVPCTVNTGTDHCKD